ncbi:hypothetical protein BZG36_01795 [Bifiguratus adelaidae]|uniref:Uncharacterized protein n=1 Tax=Bifiguratus adelaidae TaxID=1938954 RepID=A0A261Y2E3_9FUNG|nr:hypothetical protein BZG36_01795 [Bifiguratus adelaidae]
MLNIILLCVLSTAKDTTSPTDTTAPTDTSYPTPQDVSSHTPKQGHGLINLGFGQYPLWTIVIVALALFFAIAILAFVLLRRMIPTRDRSGRTSLQRKVRKPKQDLEGGTLLQPTFTEKLTSFAKSTALLKGDKTPKRKSASEAKRRSTGESEAVVLPLDDEKDIVAHDEIVEQPLAQEFRACDTNAAACSPRVPGSMDEGKQNSNAENIEKKHRRSLLGGILRRSAASPSPFSAPTNVSTALEVHITTSLAVSPSTLNTFATAPSPLDSSPYPGLGTSLHRAMVEGDFGPVPAIPDSSFISTQGIQYKSPDLMQLLKINTRLEKADQATNLPSTDSLAVGRANSIGTSIGTSIVGVKSKSSLRSPDVELGSISQLSNERRMTPAAATYDQSEFIKSPSHNESISEGDRGAAHRRSYQDLRRKHSIKKQTAAQELRNCKMNKTKRAPAKKTSDETLGTSSNSIPTSSEATIPIPNSQPQHDLTSPHTFHFDSDKSSDDNVPIAQSDSIPLGMILPLSPNQNSITQRIIIDHRTPAERERDSYLASLRKEPAEASGNMDSNDTATENGSIGSGALQVKKRQSMGTVKTRYIEEGLDASASPEASTPRAFVQQENCTTSTGPST